MTGSLSELILSDLLDPDLEPPELNDLRMRAAVERARAHLRDGADDVGRAHLQAVLDGVDGRTDPLGHALRGIARSVWGQALEGWGQIEGAHEQFTWSLAAFLEACGADLDLQGLRRLAGAGALADLATALGGLDDPRAEGVLLTTIDAAAITPEGMRRLAELKVGSGDLDGAARLVDEALAMIPFDARCWHLQAQIRERRDVSGSVEAYRHSAALSLHRGAFRQALAPLLRLQERAPEDPSVLLAIAESHRHTGEVERAYDECRDALALDADHVGVRLCQAMVAKQLDRLDEALGQVTVILAHDPRNPGALLIRGRIREDRREFAAALEDAEGALEAQPGWSEAQALQGRVLVRMERFEEASAPLKSAHERSPRDVRIALEYARVVGKLGDSREVVETMVDIWTEPGLELSDITTLIEALISVDEPGKAENVAREWLTRMPGDPFLGRLLGVAVARRAIRDDLSGDALRTAVAEASALAPDEPDVLVIRARQARADSQIDEADQLLVRALSIVPKHEEALIELTDLLTDRERAGDAERVEALARTGLEMAPSVYFQLQLAWSLSRQGRDREALSLLAEEPEDANRATRRTWLSLRAGSNEALGRWSHAQADRATLAELVPEESAVWFDLADAARMAGDYATAVRAGERALDLDPQNVLAMGTTAAALADAGQLARARELLDTALGARPDYEWALTQRAYLATSLDEASELIGRLERLQPDEIALRISRGRIMSTFERFEEALADFEWVLSRQPHNVSALNSAAISAAALGQLDRASARARQALELEPENSDVLITLAYVEKERGDFPGALEHLQRASDLQPDNTRMLPDLVAVLRNLDRVEESFDLLGDLVRRNPDDAVLWYTVGDHLLQLGYGSEAVGPFSRSIQLSPDNAWAHSGLGSALLSQPDPDTLDRALAEFETANRLAPDRVRLMLAQANVRHEMRDDTAARLYREILDKLGREPRSNLTTRWERGWCLFRLRELEQAGRLIFAATALPVDGPGAQFDLAVVSLCQGRDTEAIETYELALSVLAARGRPRRSALQVARRDLETAVRDWGLEHSPATTRIRELIAAALADVPEVAIPEAFLAAAVDAAPVRSR